MPTIFARKFYEVQGNLSMTRHMLQNNMIVINKRQSLAQAEAGDTSSCCSSRSRQAVSAKNTELGSRAREASMLDDIRKTGKTKIIEEPSTVTRSRRKRSQVVLTRGMEAPLGQAENLEATARQRSKPGARWQVIVDAPRRSSIRHGCDRIDGRGRDGRRTCAWLVVCMRLIAILVMRGGGVPVLRSTIR